MQPQSPYGPPNPGGQGSPQPPYTPGQSPLPGQPLPGQQYQAGQPQPYAPGVPGQQYQPGQPQAPQPQIPGQPAMPTYQMPANMQPRNGQQTNVPPPPDAPTTPYDFFLQPKPAQAVNPLPATGKRIGNAPVNPGNGNKAKFLLLAGGGLALVLIIGIGTAFLPKDQTGPQLFNIAQIQQEVVRVCSQGTKAKFQSTRNFAVTCSAGVAANQTELLAYMQKQNLSFDGKLIGLKASGQVDSRLKSAASSSTYDATFREIMQGQLKSYEASLESQLTTTTGANARDVLSKSQRSAELLSLMVADDSDKTEAPAEEAQAATVDTATEE